MRLFVVAALAACVHPAYALTGTDALRQVRTRAGETAIYAYMMGTMEAELVVRKNAGQLAAAGLKPTYAPYCAPDGATADQAWAIVNKFLSDNPEFSHYEMAVLARTALLRVWPCQ